jgi:dolichol-phosphate mannosyltransferase
LTEKGIPFEVIVINDNSTDDTESILQYLSRTDQRVHYINNPQPHGIGAAIRTGLATFSGNAVAIMMADGSDSPNDLVKYYRQLQKGYECIFGSRFVKGGRVSNYPKHKLVLNRLANWGIQVLFGTPCNDITNAFKCYRREVIEHIQPLTSTHFNILVEIPLKAISHGFCYTVLPIQWENRKHGISKLRIREMSVHYLSTIFRIFGESIVLNIRRARASHNK